MTIHRIAVVLVVAVGVFVGTVAEPFVARAHAQDAPSWRLPVTMGQAVWVTALDGWEVKGVISDITATTIDVSGEAGTKRLNVTDIRRVAKRDSLKNGFWIGAAVGAIPAFLLVGSAADADLDNSENVASAFGFVVFSSLAYGGIGMLIDRAIEGRRTIYEKSGVAAAVQLGPIVTRHGVGLGGTIRW